MGWRRRWGETERNGQSGKAESGGIERFLAAVSTRREKESFSSRFPSPRKGGQEDAAQKKRDVDPVPMPKERG